MTKVLEKEGYWGSYNVPSFKETRKNLGYDEIITRYKGEAIEFGYESNSRGYFIQN